MVLRLLFELRGLRLLGLAWQDGKTLLSRVQRPCSPGDFLCAGSTSVMLIDREYSLGTLAWRLDDAPQDLAMGGLSGGELPSLDATVMSLEPHRGSASCPWAERSSSLGEVQFMVSSRTFPSCW